jgi:hypothetical protein
VFELDIAVSIPELQIGAIANVHVFSPDAAKQWDWRITYIELPPTGKRKKPIYYQAHNEPGWHGGTKEQRFRIECGYFRECLDGSISYEDVLIRAWEQIKPKAQP